MRRALLGLTLAAVTSLGACVKNVNRDEAVARANAAHARGDLVGEALALRDACGYAKDDKDLCKRAGGAWTVAQTHVREDAARACHDPAGPPGGPATTPATSGGGSLDSCLRAIGEVRRMVPDDPSVAGFAARAGEQHLAHCVAEAPAWQSSIDDALELVRCGDARAAAIAVPAYSEQLLAHRTAARDQLVALLRRPEIVSHHGASAELLDAAVCLAPSSDLVAQARQVRETFARRARASIDLRASQSTPLPDLCAAVEQTLGGRAACGPSRDGAPQLTVGGEIALSPVEHQAYDTTEHVDYVAGIIRFENPEYQPAVRHEQDAQRARDEAQSQNDRDQSQCRSAESALSSVSATCAGSCPEQHERDRACNLAQTSESTKRQRESDYDDARRHLSETPPISERKDIRTATYTVRHHSWRVPWRAKLRNDGKTTEVGGETTTTDDETSGAEVAGVQADPLTSPGDRWYIPAIREQVSAEIAKIVDESLRRRASDLEATCSGPPAFTADFLECWARTRFWTARGATPETTLLRAVTDASDRQKGSAWPPLQCIAPSSVGR